MSELSSGSSAPREVIALGYVGTTAPDIGEFEDFATSVLGMQVGAGSGPERLRLRIDERALDAVQERSADTITLTLGKHTNDRMTSFYVKSPGGFNIEYGCGGVHIDDSVWTSASYNAISFWGHKGADLPSEAKA